MRYKKVILCLVSMLTAFFSLAQVEKGLVASYYFSGNAIDIASQINGIVRGASLSYDRFGNANAAYCFDGVNDYITLGTNTDLRQASMSISCWVKLNNFKSNNFHYPGIPYLFTRTRHAVEYYEAYAMGINGRNLKFGGSVSSPMLQQVANISNVKPQLEKWYHVVYMFDDDTTCLYVDGKLEQKNYKGFISNYQVTDSVVLGYAGNQMPDTFKYRNYAYFNGCLDDIKFYNRRLSHEEVSDLYNEPNPKFVGEPGYSGKVSLLALFEQLWHVLVTLIGTIFLIILIIRWRIRYFRRKEQEKNELQQKFAQLEMKALRSQMNPHFIFNAINSIQHYVLTNEKELANKYLVKFSQLMRNILDLSKQELISLKDELGTVKLYLDIESLRFNNAFSYSIAVAEDVFAADIRLPPLLVQPFVENAIWHGLLLKQGNKKLQINVVKKDNSIVIEIDDNGIGREAAQKFSNKELKRRSFGMDITQDRLSVLEKVFGISISFYVMDKRDNKEEALGTTVFINIKL